MTRPIDTEPGPGHVEITDHALARWLERRHGVDLSFVRWLAGSVIGSTPPGDKVLMRTIERVLGVDMDPLRRELRDAVDGAVAARRWTWEREDAVRVELDAGHLAILSVSPERTWRVATVLDPSMTEPRTPRRSP